MPCDYDLNTFHFPSPPFLPPKLNHKIHFPYFIFIEFHMWACAIWKKNKYMNASCSVYYRNIKKVREKERTFIWRAARCEMSSTFNVIITWRHFFHVKYLWTPITYGCTKRRKRERKIERRKQRAKKEERKSFILRERKVEQCKERKKVAKCS